jgi:hypothetical protein
VNSPLVNVAQNEYWQIDQTAGSANASLSLYWEDATASGINNCADLTVAHWNGSGWDERAATTTSLSSCSGAGAGTVTTNTVVTAFSPFTFGSRSTLVNPLPVELIAFDAKCNSDHVSLNWTTASEKGNAYFILERSVDAAHWTDVDHIAGAMNSQVARHYSYSDNYSGQEQIYYRLIQVDADGTRKAGDIIEAQCDESTGPMKIYPNPADRELYVELNTGNANAEGLLKIIDCLGRTCFQQTVIAAKGRNTFKLTYDLPAGMYSVVFASLHANLPPQKLIIR